MSSPFVNVVVQPAYGKRETLISWDLAYGYDDLRCYVCKSENNGGPPWKVLNETATTSNSFLDTDLVVLNRMHYVFYQIVGVRGDTKFKTAPMGMFDQLSRSEYGQVAKILSLEKRRMTSGNLGNGIPIYHYMPLSEGVPNAKFDPITRQKLIATCPDDGSYGLPYQGGYGPPVQSWLELYSMGPEILSDDEGGQGANNGFVLQKTRMLAYPKPATNQLIIHKDTDNRYVIGEQIQPYYFRGSVAVAYDVMLQLLRRNDPRYNIPVP